MSLTDEQLAKELFRAGLVTADVIQQAAAKRTPGKNLARVLVDSGILTEGEVAEIDPSLLKEPAASTPTKSVAPPSTGESPVDLTQMRIDPDAASSLPRDLAVSLRAIPLSRSGNRITVAMVDPRNLPAIDEISNWTGCKVEPVPASLQQVMLAINQTYSSGAVNEVSDIASAAASEAALREQVSNIVELIDEAPTVKIVNRIIHEAVVMGASDIHAEPRQDGLYLRYRVDGVLRPPTKLDKMMEAGIISRLKVLSELDLAESRLPQDGRFRQVLGNRVVDFRVSTLPTYHGEKVVLRLLDKSSLVGLDKLGFQPDMGTQFEELILRPQGMILVTGPTGSGKSTTLYAALNRCKSETKNVVTVEDPVEYQLEGINQTQVLPQINLTFARQLRAILRQDPDVILVGEVRDQETADMAFRAALTGHLVLSTLHTNDAPSSVTRLQDMGVEPYLIASCILACLAQRLVRVICPKCKEPYKPEEFEVERLGLNHEETRSVQFFRGKGCSNCAYSGYRGRIGVYELMAMTEAIRKQIVKSATASELRLAAISNGMMTLRQDGWVKVKQGQTTLEELTRVLFASVEDERQQDGKREPELQLELEEPANAVPK